MNIKQSMIDRGLAFFQAVKNRQAKLPVSVADESTRVEAHSTKVKKSDCKSCRRKRNDGKSIRE